ncbi:MAG: DNA polymerase [Acidimicrobiales bacterium]
MAAELKRIATKQRDVVGRLATLTGGGQEGTLFDDAIEPSWNPGSDQQVKQALNQWASEQVRAYTQTRYGIARDLDATDSVSRPVLRDIGGELCHALLDFRGLTKILSTYGESIHEHLHDDGRLRPQYLQVVGTSTGRLASRNPNAQNFTPMMKPYFRPADPSRVFVHADLSQAELRFLAEVANDEPLRAAFARGDDVHVSTAASMFGFDPVVLAADDPARYKHLRQIAKALNFGIAYGTGAAALGRSLTNEGAPTTKEEATELLAQYRRTYPGTAAWAEQRIAEIQQIANETVEIDWPLTLRLARGFNDLTALRRSFRRSQNRWPSAAEIVAIHPDRHERDADELLATIEWQLGYSAPVALLADGDPFTFSTRTVAGRRQQFNLHLDRLFLNAAIDAIRTDPPGMHNVKAGFAHDHGVDLGGPGRDVSDKELDREFEDRSLRQRFIDAIGRELGDEVAHRFLQRAAKDRVSAMVNAWRNAPIQGGVADIMLVAYADLQQRLQHYPGAVPVQTVHDSVVVECNEADAVALVDEVREALESASLRFCPT